MNRLSIIVPCYYEEAVLPETTKRLLKLLEELINDNVISSDSYILYVNDGSQDRTWALIEEYHSLYKHIKGVNLAGNVGHQNALIAGLSVALNSCDIAVTIDADLQDDVNAIRDMVKKYDEGSDIVYGVRASRKTDTWFKRATAQGFYRIMKFLGVKSVYNHADYRLMSKRAVQYLLSFRERNIFLRGLVPLIGYKTDCVYYDRAERFAGESKYPLRKMLTFAFDGITSFSVVPVHMVLIMGLLFLLVAFCILIWVGYLIITGGTIRGWASLMLSIWFCSGCLLVGMGIVGEYIGKIYIEVKDRPRYNIEKSLV
jgi:glycosyltransferase involved in cell wall biosynthesis